jgi:hypothetical protein
VCRPSTGTCDVAESCSGSTAACPVDTGLPDQDADTFCDLIDNCPGVSNPDQGDDDGDGDGDACDICNNFTGSTVLKPRLYVRVVGDGKDKITYSGTADMPHLPLVDLVAKGFRFVLQDAQNDTVVDANIPPGAYSAASRNGWRANGRGGFTYKNNGGPLNNGLFAVTVNELRGAPGTFQFRIKAKAGTYTLAQADLPVKATVVLDPPSAETTGQCTEAEYSSECRFNKAGTTVRCKGPI